LPKSAGGRVIVKWKREGTTTRRPRPGRPHLMTDKDRRALKKVVRETRQTWSETIARDFAVLRIIQRAPWLCVES
jgi:transposase